MNQHIWGLCTGTHQAPWLESIAGNGTAEVFREVHKLRTSGAVTPTIFIM